MAEKSEQAEAEKEVKEETTAADADVTTAGTEGPESASEEVKSGDDKKSASKSKKKHDKELEELKAANEKLDADLAELKDQYLRKQADFDNFRKRMIRDKEDSIRYANSQLLMDLISVIDDFERALQSGKESEDFEKLYSGIEIIEKQMVGMLESNWGLKRFDSAGEEFNPERHEALMMEENGDYDTQTVLEDYMKGYTLHDRVVRHAKVKVSKPVEKQTE